MKNGKMAKTKSACKMYVSRLRQWQCATSIIIRFGIDKYEQINNSSNVTSKRT